MVNVVVKIRIVALSTPLIVRGGIWYRKGGIDVSVAGTVAGLAAYYRPEGRRSSRGAGSIQSRDIAAVRIGIMAVNT
jgi:hypothetical protein